MKDKENKMATAAVKTVVGTPALEKLEKQYADISTRLADLEATEKTLKAKILVELEQQYGHEGLKYISAATGGTLQRIIQIRATADEDKLRKSLTTEQWDIVKEEKVNMDKLQAAILIGTINPAKVDGLSSKEIDKLAWKPAK
jgi:hypothetical protein